MGAAGAGGAGGAGGTAAEVEEALFLFLTVNLLFLRGMGGEM